MIAVAWFVNRNLILTVIFCVILLILPAGAIPAGTETRISFSTDPGCMNIYPSSDAGWIVWEESCWGITRTIIAYNYTTGLQLTLPNATLTPNAPNIRNDRVVWSEDSSGGMNDIYYTDLDVLPLTAHKINVPLSVKYHPVVDGGNLVWQNQEPGSLTSDILMFNLSRGTLYNLTPDTPDSDQRFPSIYGDRVVYENVRMGGVDIFMNDTAANWTTVNLTPGLLSVFNSRPIINGNSVVWSDDTYNIYLSDLTTTSLVTGDPYISVLNPSVSSPYIVWKEDTTGSQLLWYDVMLYDTLTSVKEPVTGTQYVNPDMDAAPVLITPDSRIIWVDDRNGQSDIYMFALGITETCPVAGFSANTTEGPAPLTVEFSDTSTGSPTHWMWDFGNGTYDANRNITHTFSIAGIYYVRFTSGNPYCRSSSAVQTISVGTPNVDFSAIPTEGLIPLSVTFSGTATGSPASWLWEFGDNTTSTQQNPVHIYSSGGTYTVNLSASNTFGTGVKSKTGYITVKSGARSIAFTNISGVLVSGPSGRQNLTYDTSLVPDYSLSGDKTTLVSRPPGAYGWQNITFVSYPGSLFDDRTMNISGPISTVILRTQDILPSSFPPDIGSNLKINYEAEYNGYFSPAYLVTEVWEGTMFLDSLQFENIIHSSGFTSKNVAYTMSVSSHNLPIPSRGRVNFSLSSGWLAGTSGIDEGRDQTHVIVRGYDPAGNLAGTVIKPVFAGNDSVHHLEYFEADIPPQFAYVTTFAPARLSGSGNLFQLITLTIAPFIGPESSSDTGGSGDIIYTPGNVKTTQTPDIKPTSLPDTGKTARLYLNDKGVITQATTLGSMDGLASVFIRRGVVVKNSTGAVPTSITISSLAADTLPGIPDGSGFSYAGMAYDLQPDGCTFSPAISLNFTIPQAGWGQEFLVKTYDETTMTWLEVPTTYHPDSGIVTAELSHFCPVGLFARAVIPATPDAAADMPTQIPATPGAPPAPTAFSTFSSLILWVIDSAMKNMVLTAGLVIVAVAIFLYGRKRRRDRIMYLL